MFKRFLSTAEFWSEISPFLRGEESRNALGLGLAKMFVDKPEACFYQSAIVEDGKLRGSFVGSIYGDQQSLIASPVSDAGAAADLFQGFRRAGIRLDNLIADWDTAQIYKNLLESAGFKTHLLTKQGVYRCRAVEVPDSDASITFRPAENRDLAVLAKLIEEFVTEAVPHDPRQNWPEIAAQRVASKSAYVLEKNGRLVTMAGWSRDLGSSCSVNLVYTPKEFRRKGYASLVTAKLTRLLLDEGRRETNLFTDMANPTSNKIYQDIGYEFLGYSAHYRVS